MKKKFIFKTAIPLVASLTLAITACTDSTSADTPEEPESSESIGSSESTQSSDATIPLSSGGANSSANTALSSGTSEALQSSSSVIPGSSDTPIESSSSDTGPASPGDSFTDPRDGKTYKLTTIGSQVWMAENLRYGDSSLYVSKDAWKICPEGFHLPSSEEFKTLVAYAGGEEIAGQKLKSTTGWPNLPAYDDWNGTDDFGFNAKPVASGNGTGGTTGDGASSDNGAGAPGSDTSGAQGGGSGQTSAPADQGGSPDSAPAPEESSQITVTVSIDASLVGAAGGSTTVTLERGATAYDALLASGVSVSARPTGFGMYVDAINGVVCEWGKKCGVPTPVNDRIVEVIKKEQAGALPLDKSNIRLFDDLK